jgi:hypothetical protein
MKNIISKTALVFLGVIVLLSIAINSYMLLVMVKLSTSRGFESIKIMAEYKVFSRIWVGTCSMFLTMVMLIILMVFIVREILLKSRKRTYHINDIPDPLTYNFGK